MIRCNVLTSKYFDKIVEQYKDDWQYEYKLTSYWHKVISYSEDEAVLYFMQFKQNLRYTVSFVKNNGVWETKYDIDNMVETLSCLENIEKRKIVWPYWHHIFIN